MAGTRYGLELRAQYSWDVEPVYLVKADGFWAESNVPEQIVFGTELTTEVGGVREQLTVDQISWNTVENRLEVELSANVAAGVDDLTFNRLAIVRGGKAQGSYIGDLTSGVDQITLTDPSPLPEPFSPGDRLVDEDFNLYTITSVAGNVLDVAETITASATGKALHDASGTLMVVYVFVQAVTVFANSTVKIILQGYDFAA